MIKEKKKFIVFKQHLAGWLMIKGFVLLGLEPTIQGDKYRNVFIFNETKSLQLAIKEYKQLQQNK